MDTSEVCGVRKAEVTVTYRFSQPDQGMPLLMAQSYTIGSETRVPLEPKTIGDHIRKRRLALKMLQRRVAEQLGVTKPCLYNWERNSSIPDVRYMPAIIRYLGYNPLPSAETLAVRLVQGRQILGLTQEGAARRMGVDPGTLARWERGEREPRGAFLSLVERFLDQVGS